MLLSEVVSDCRSFVFFNSLVIGNDRTMKKKSYSSDDVSLAEKLSNAKRKRSLT